VSLSFDVSVISIETVADESKAVLFVSQETVKSELLKPSKFSEKTIFTLSTL
jgi:hypothetical protein